MESKLKKTQAMALAKGSKANLRSQGRKLLFFLSHQGLDFPLSEHQVCLYIQYLMEDFKSNNSVRNYLSGAKTFHSLLGYEFPSLSSIEVKLTLRGMEKSLGHKVKKAIPVDVRLLVDIYEQLDMLNYTHIVFWCLFLFMFFLFARKSQFLPLTARHDDLAKVVQRNDIVDKHDMLCCTFRWSKTNQAGERIELPVVPVKDSVLCPVVAYRRMVEVVESSGPAFVLPSGNGIGTPITYSKFQSFFRSMVVATGREGEGYSSHSFRRGGASFALKLGLSPLLIKSQGDWKSDAYLGYIDLSYDQRLELAHSFAIGVVN